MARLLVFLRHGNASAGDEEMIQRRIQLQRDIAMRLESGLPFLKIRGGWNLEIAASLKDQNRNLQDFGDRDRVIIAQIEPVCCRDWTSKQVYSVTRLQGRTFDFLGCF